MTKDEAKKLLEVYGKAWVTRDPDLILSIFTEDATYHDPHEPKNSGHDAIRQYWITKVVGEQDDISFALRNVWVDADTVIAEWHATFTDTQRHCRIELDEVAILKVVGDKFASLREHYTSTKTSL